MKTLDLSQVNAAAGGTQDMSLIIFGQDYASRMGIM